MLLQLQAGIRKLQSWFQRKPSPIQEETTGPQAGVNDINSISNQLPQLSNTLRITNEHGDVVSRQVNKGDGGTSGHGEMDPVFQPPGPVYPDPGPRTLTDPDWVRRDMLFKSSLPRQKYY